MEEQSYKNWEAILIDDGSSDGSFDIAIEFQRRNPDKVKLIRQENKGQCAASNLAIEYVTGDYIQFLDGDDVLDKDKIRTQIYELDRNTAEGIVAVSNWGRFRNSRD